MERLRSHYSDLLRIIVEQELGHPDGIAVSNISSLMSRGDGLDIFKEGDLFSGNIRQNEAEVSLTVTSSPHFRSTIPLDEFISVASREFGREVCLPDRICRSAIAPHLMLWWQRVVQNDTAKWDFLDLYTSPLETKEDFIQCIERQAVKALRLLNNFGGMPIIYGTWGYGTSEEKPGYGLSRGSPTIAHGHCHVATVSEQEQGIVLRKDLNNNQKLKHYAPWNRLINERFGPDIAQALEEIARKGEAWGQARRAVFSRRTIKHSRERSSTQEGYEIHFKNPTEFHDAFSLVVDAAGTIERVYQGIGRLYEQYYKNIGDEDMQRQIREQIRLLMVNFRFNEMAAESFVDFVLRISPTYGQMKEWKTQLEKDKAVASKHAALQILGDKINKRDQFTDRVGRKSSNEPLRVSLVHDTYKDPYRRGIIHTWPVHSSACYLFDDIFVDRNKIWVRKLSILPAIISTAGAPERMLGAELVRDAGSNN